MEDNFLESIAYILPAVVVGVVAQYMLKGFFAQQNSLLNKELLRTKKTESLPVRLQAYERILLFCERINPTHLVKRVHPISEDLTLDLELLLKTIEQEFEHNVIQQLYISDTSWRAVVSTKKIMENQLKQIATNSSSVKEFREKILLNSSFTNEKINTVQQILKEDVKKII